MNSYIAVTGVITQIQPDTGDGSNYGCSMTITIQSYYQGPTLFTLSGDTYVVDNALLQPGDRVTFFYNANAPTPLIYPPKYKAVVAAKSNIYQYYLGQFDNDFMSLDRTLQMNGNVPIRFILPNGQNFPGAIVGKTVLVEYSSASKSIPALINPNRVIVFCYGS